MKNKRSIGVIIFGISFIIISVLNISGYISDIVDTKYAWAAYFYIIISIILLILTVFLLQLKEWARKGVIYYHLVSALVIKFLIMPLMSERHEILSPTTGTFFDTFILVVWTILVIYFFTRPEVKHRFN